MGNVHKVASFREKPNLETAKQYLEAGNYLWNAGIFVWNVRTLVASIRQYVPQIAGLMDRMVPTDGKKGEPADTVFPICEKISIDYAVMEKHDILQPMIVIGQNGPNEVPVIGDNCNICSGARIMGGGEN